MCTDTCSMCSTTSCTRSKNILRNMYIKTECILSTWENFVFIPSIPWVKKMCVVNKHVHKECLLVSCSHTQTLKSGTGKKRFLLVTPVKWRREDEKACWDATLKKAGIIWTMFTHSSWSNILYTIMCWTTEPFNDAPFDAIIILSPVTDRPVEMRNVSNRSQVFCCRRPKGVWNGLLASNSK